MNSRSVVVGGEDEVLEPAHRGLTAELVEQVLLGAGHRVRLPDRPASLRHDRTDRDVVGQQDRDRAARCR